MSMPKFPEVDPEITCDSALNMILTSIAMEELALSHIINAEGEKLQYVLGTLETTCGREFDIEEILAVNKSITCLLDSVSQNQMILKNKMDKAIDALAEVCPGSSPSEGCPSGCPSGGKKPTDHCSGKRSCGCSGKCNAAFQAEKCGIWCPDTALCWEPNTLRGECVVQDSCDKAKIILRSRGQFMINFAVNVCAKLSSKSNASISLQTLHKDQCTDLYTVHSPVSADTMITISMGGIIVNTVDQPAPFTLLLRLVSSDTLTTESAMISIVEI